MSSKTKFITDFRVFLRSIDDGWESQSDVQEFRQWMNDELMPFKTVSAHEQFHEKINYEISIGNENVSFMEISAFMIEWLEKYSEAPLDYIWYHGTSERKLEKIMSVGMIERSSEKTSQHEGFEHDIGTVSLAKGKRNARFFSAIGREDSNVVLHIDIRNLDSDKMRYRVLFDSPDGELLYFDDIPVNAIVKVEKI